MNQQKELFLEFEDTEWQLNEITHERLIARAIVIDDKQQFYFIKLQRNDEFGKAELIETTGGGVEFGETLEWAICREIQEELGVKVEIITKLGIVKDAYNLINRYNINHYFLCQITEFGEKQLTQAELEEFQLSTLVLSYEEALLEYEKNKKFPLGRLITQRELPILRQAKEFLNKEYS